MANREHLRIFKSGPKAVAAWRKRNRTKYLNLRKVNFTHADLSGADLSVADLSEADFSGANLRKANLHGSILQDARLIGTDLTEANLWGVTFSSSDLALANFSSCNLAASGFLRADLFFTKLEGADLSRSMFKYSHLFETELDRATFKDALFEMTSIEGCDLSRVRQLDTVQHIFRSSVDLRTLRKTFEGAGKRFTPELWSFFRGTGISQEVLEGLTRVFATGGYTSCFICYGEPNKEFAEKLRRDLVERGVSSWLYAMDSTPGERTWHEIGKIRRAADRMIILCSSKSLIRDGVLKEIEEQIDEAPDKMIPVSLDELWKEKGFRVARGERSLKEQLLEKNYADFGSGHEYEQSLDRLLRGLRRQR